MVIRSNAQPIIARIVYIPIELPTSGIFFIRKSRSTNNLSLINTFKKFQFTYSEKQDLAKR